MGKAIAPSIKINETTHITECRDGWYLWDEGRGMNLAMRADSKEAALIEALEYYQRRLPEVEKANAAINKVVNKFLSELEPFESQKDTMYEIADDENEYRS